MRKQPVSKKNVILITLICLLFVVCAIAGDLLMKAKAASAGDLSFTFSLLMPEKAQKGTLKPWKRLYAIPDHLRIRSRRPVPSSMRKPTTTRRSATDANRPTSSRGISIRAPSRAGFSAMSQILRIRRWEKGIGRFSETWPINAPGPISHIAAIPRRNYTPIGV